MALQEPKRLMFVGDSHGDLDWLLRKVIRLGKRWGVDTLVQLGDFGIGDFGVAGVGERFLNRLNEELNKEGMRLLFLDGNHEDFDYLYSIPVDEDGFRRVKDRIIHMPRGSRWTWFSKRWMAMGGAVSIDKETRLNGITWWPQERITYGEVRRATEGGKVDILLTHDAPLMTPIVDDYPESHENRRMLQELVDVVCPEVILHGHWHRGYTTVSRNLGKEIFMMGLNMNTMNGALARFDPEKFKERALFEEALFCPGGAPKIHKREREKLGLV